MELLLPKEGFGSSQYIGCRLGKEVPLTGIALSYKNFLYQKVNYSKWALAADVTMVTCSGPPKARLGCIGQAEPGRIGREHVPEQGIQIGLLRHQDRLS